MSIYETHKPSKGSGDYLKLKDGDKVKVRFASEPAVVTYDGDKIRYQWIIYNRNDKKAQIYEAGVQVFSQLADLFPEWGDPTGYDVTISRTGSGQFDTSYSVTPSPKSVDLTKEEKEAVEAIEENFIGPKRKWLVDVEKDGKLPEQIKKQTEQDGMPDDPHPADTLGENDIPPEFRG